MRTRAALLASIAAAATLAGCSGGDAVAIDPVAHAADRTTAAGTSRMRMEMAMTVQGQRLFIATDGAFDYARGRGWMTMDLGQLYAMIPGASGSPRMRMLFDRSTIWMQLPPAAMPPGGKSWIKMDVGGLTRLGGTGAGLPMMQQPDPSQMLDSLRGMSGGVRKVGTSTVRGVRSTHYRLEVDPRKAVEASVRQAPKRLRGRVRSQMNAAMALLGDDKLPVDVWIDGAGRLRKMKLDYGMAMPGAGTLDAEMTMELYGFGSRVDFTKPPASQVADFTAFLPPRS